MNVFSQSTVKQVENFILLFFSKILHSKWRILEQRKAVGIRAQITKADKRILLMPMRI